MTDCLFCRRDGIKESTLWETDNFYVKVGIGLLAPGHVMLVSKKHLSCFGELPEELEEEFLSLKRDIFDKVKTNFFEPIIYEHGIYGQSIKHAHIHFIPKKTEFYFLENMHDYLAKKIKPTEIGDIFKIRDIFKEEGSYLYLEDSNKKWVFHTKGLKYGDFIFRKEFAELTGLHGLAAWQTMPEEDKERDKIWIKETKKNLKP